MIAAAKRTMEAASPGPTRLDHVAHRLPSIVARDGPRRGPRSILSGQLLTSDFNSAAAAHRAALHQPIHQMDQGDRAA